MDADMIGINHSELAEVDYLLLWQHLASMTDTGRWDCPTYTTNHVWMLHVHVHVCMNTLRCRTLATRDISYPNRQRRKQQLAPYSSPSFSVKVKRPGRVRD